MWAHSPHLKKALHKPIEEQAWPAVCRDAQNQTLKATCRSLACCLKVCARQGSRFALPCPSDSVSMPLDSQHHCCPSGSNRTHPLWTPGLLQTQFPGLTLWHGPGLRHPCPAPHHGPASWSWGLAGLLQHKLVLGWAADTSHVGGTLPQLNPGWRICFLLFMGGAPHGPASSSSVLRRLPLAPRAWWAGASRLARS